MRAEVAGGNITGPWQVRRCGDESREEEGRLERQVWWQAVSRGTASVYARGIEGVRCRFAVQCPQREGVVIKGERCGGGAKGSVGM